MRIYLAGKITGTDWRRHIIGRMDFDKRYAYDPWTVLEGAIWEEHDYTGPFWTDHHNETSTHAQGDIEANEREREQIFQNCWKAVHMSDFVFVRYLRDEVSIGSCVEVAWAYAAGIPVYGYGDDGPGTWFLRSMCELWIPGTGDKSKELFALEDVLEHIKEYGLPKRRPRR